MRHNNLHRKIHIESIAVKNKKGEWVDFCPTKTEQKNQTVYLTPSRIKRLTTSPLKDIKEIMKKKNTTQKLPKDFGKMNYNANDFVADTNKSIFDLFTKQIKESTQPSRKEFPIYSGVIKYFPDALYEVSHVSFVGNEKHNPGEPLHWAREKSTDDIDAALRHITDHAKGIIFDPEDNQRSLAKAAWRLLATLQKELEK